MSADDSLLLSSYAKLMLYHWPVLLQIIRTLSQPSDQPSSSDTKLPSADSIISAEQLKQALSSPYRSWLLEVFSHYAKLAQWNLECTLKKDKTVKEALKKQGAEDVVSISDPLTEDQLKKLSKAKLELMQKDLEKLTREQYQAWLKFYEHWADKLIAQLVDCGVPLSHEEEIEIKRFDPAHEVINIANELQLTLDKTLYNPNQFSVYFQLKATLTIRSSLSRRQKPAENKNIDRSMKQLNTLFSVIKKQETEQIKLDREAFLHALTL